MTSDNGTLLDLNQQLKTSMAKLYAELSSDKGGRVVGKGGERIMTTRYYIGNKCTHVVKYEEPFLTVFTMTKNGKQVQSAKILQQ